MSMCDFLELLAGGALEEAQVESFQTNLCWQWRELGAVCADREARVLAAQVPCRIGHCLKDHILKGSSDG